ncbi:MAG: hypothetical protein IH899_04985 [Planctomycetes bacterium]|nr:hypothetical protein [Planctomycetota bacterium]
MDGRHYPCPRCGGKDRFRAINDFAEMRHESIETTLKHYVGWNAQNTAEALSAA